MTQNSFLTMLVPLCLTLNLIVVWIFILLLLVAKIEESQNLVCIPKPTTLQNSNVEYINCPSVTEWLETTDYWQQCQPKPEHTSTDSKVQFFGALNTLLLRIDDIVFSFLLSFVEYFFEVAALIIDVITHIYPVPLLLFLLGY